MNKIRRNINKRNRFSLIFPFLSIIGIAFVYIISTGYEKSWNFDWSEIRTEIKDSIMISKFRGITSGMGGMGVSTKDEVQRRTWIMKEASVTELLKLSEYPNGNIKAIALEGLLRKKEVKNKTEVILNAINDNKFIVNYQSGCIGEAIGVGKYIVSYVLSLDGSIPPFPNNLKLPNIDRDKILTEFNNRQPMKFEIL